MELKIKRLSEDAILPVKAHKGDAGFDLTATRITQEINECGQLLLVYHSDLAVEIPEGYVGCLFMRSSVSKKSLAMCNAVGVIDSGYRGEVTGKFRSTTDVVPAIYKPGDKFAQLVILPLPEFEVVEATELTNTDRGEGGYGSTDENSAVTLPSEENSEPAADSQSESEAA